MSTMQQIKIPATYMRGGTSKGVFFRLQDLPESCQVAGAARDRLFMRVIGSPDPYAKHIDGIVWSCIQEAPLFWKCMEKVCKIFVSEDAAEIYKEYE